MPFLPLAILGALLLVNWFVSAFFLWLSAKICRVRGAEPVSVEGALPPRSGIRFRRALAVVLSFTLLGSILVGFLWFAMPLRAESALGFSAAALVLHVVLLLVFMRAFVARSLGRAFLVGLLWQVLGILYSVAFVFIVSSSLVSGYVQPTGAMAETLFGYHKDVHCPTCGFEFAINCSSEVVFPEQERPTPVFACVCPNCRQRIHFPSAPPMLLRDFPDSIEIPDPGPNSGDRFLVVKGLLGPRVIAPRRFDLFAHEYTLQRSEVYLKRLIGLPGETIAIRSGDLYVLDPNKGLKYDDAETRQEPRDPFAARMPMHPDDSEAIRRFEQGQFEILRKSPEQMLALRHIVYDNDHPAKDQPVRWVSTGGWKAGDDHSFALSPDSGTKTAWLRYRHILPDHDGKPALITDFTGYNAYWSSLHQPLLGYNWVGDLILECDVTLDRPQGELTLELSHGVDRFRAHWDLSNGTCTLLRVGADSESVLDSKPTTLSKRGSYRLRLANVDRRLTVWVNEDLPFGEGIAYPAPARLGPSESNDLEPASIGARGSAVTVRRLMLFRDTYYTVGGEHHDRPNDPDIIGIDFTDPNSWKALSKSPLLTMYVQPGNYLVLGDNSAESSDSRYWGSVPDRLLLGRAFFVYYPLQRAGLVH